MAKLNTYELKGALDATLQLIGIIPGSGDAFETVRLSNAALIAFIEHYAGADGTNGKQVELRKGSTNIEWRYVGDVAWTALIAIADLKGDKGDAGEQVQLQKSSTAIQWKYASGSTWTDLVLLTAISGTNGTNGRTMWSTTGAPSGALGVDGDFANDSAASMMYGPKASGSWGAGTSYKGAKGDTGTGLKNRGAWVTGTTYSPGDYVFSTGSATASSMWILNGAVDYVSNTLPKDDPTKWVEFVAPAGADGVDGKNVEMRNSGTVIQWRLVGDATWTDLVTVAALKGAKGDTGDAGAAGKTMLSTTGVPSNAVGVDGDFNNDSTNFVMYGPKAGGVWPAGKVYKGTNGTNGSDGAAGSKWWFGTTVPAAGTGANGDFYLRDTGDVYGPKAAGAWGSVVASMKGAKGDAGAAGTGVPAGGTTGQVLSKVSATDYAVQWTTPSGGGGSGLPTGGTVGQGLIKKSLTDGDAEWKTVLYGIAGTGDYTTFTAVNIKTAFSNELAFLGPVAWPSSTKITVASAKCNLNYNTNSQYVNISADTAAVEFTLPSEANNGTEIYLLVPFTITAVTWVPGTKWGSTPALKGFPTTLAPGMYQLRFFAADIVMWFFGK